MKSIKINDFIILLNMPSPLDVKYLKYIKNFQKKSSNSYIKGYYLKRKSILECIGAIMLLLYER